MVYVFFDESLDRYRISINKQMLNKVSSHKRVATAQKKRDILNSVYIPTNAHNGHNVYNGYRGTKC